MADYREADFNSAVGRLWGIPAIQRDLRREKHGG